MASITNLAARRDVALARMDAYLSQISEALGINIPERDHPKGRDELHRTAYRLEWMESVLGVIAGAVKPAAVPASFEPEVEAPAPKVKKSK